MNGSMTHTAALPAPSPPATPSARPTARAYVRLAKLDIYDYYFSVVVVWAMLPSGERTASRTLMFLALFLGGEIAACAAMCAFDDVTGYRDGSDLANYGPDQSARRLRRKPLVAGTLTQRQALRFGWSALAACAVLWAGAVAVAPHRPAWAVAGVVAWTLIGFQYSWWLSLSYHGMQELFLAALGWAFMLPTYGLLAGSANGLVVVQTLLFSLGPLLFGVYSNTIDIEGDRAVNRPTVANTLSPAGNRLFIGALSLAEAALILVPSATGLAPRWFALVLSPLIVLRVFQFHVGMRRGRILQARLLGIRAHRVGVVLLVTADLIYGGVR